MFYSFDRKYALEKKHNLRSLSDFSLAATILYASRSSVIRFACGFS